MVDKYVRIGQVGGQNRIVIGDIGAQEQGRHAIEAELEAGEEAGIAMKETVRAIGGGPDISMAIEHGKAIAVLERSLRPGRRRGFRRSDGIDDKLHGSRPGLVQMSLLAVSVDSVRSRLRSEPLPVEIPLRRGLQRGPVELDVIAGHSRG